MEEQQDIDIDQVIVSTQYQCRHMIDSDTVEDYADTAKNGDCDWVFDTPCTVFNVDGKLYLTDGFHRLEAQKKAGRRTIRAIVRTGTHTEALEAALGSNHRHGLKRSNVDKQRCVTMALADPNIAKRSDRMIATICGVHHQMVARKRPSDAPVRKAADGKAAPSKTAAARTRSKVKEAIARNPTRSTREIAAEVGCDQSTVVRTRQSTDAVDESSTASPESSKNTTELTPLEEWQADLEQVVAIGKRFVKRDNVTSSPEKIRAIRALIDGLRKVASKIEKHAAIPAPKNTTLFEADADIPQHLCEPEFIEAWNSWWEDRKKRKLSVTPLVKKRQLKQLAIGDAEQAAAIVSKAEENQWQGIPDAIWIPRFDQGLWCDRYPPHADDALRNKIQAALTKTQGRNADGKVVDRSLHGKYNPEDAKLSLEEKRRRMMQ